MARKKSKAKTKRGRALEILVSRLEGWLADTNTIIKTPEKVYDHNAETLRDVDITIRRQVGSANVLVALECRDKGRVQGPDWIEQLRSKREGIRADRMIAVSSSGFTKSAVTLAEKYHIDLYRVDELSESDAVGWMLGTKVTVSELDFDLQGVELVARHEGDRDLELAPPLASALQHNPLGTAFLFKDDGQSMCAKALLNFAGSQRGSGVLDGVEVDGPYVAKVVKLACGEGLFTKVEGDRRVELDFVILHARFRRVNVPVPPFQGVKYVAGDGSSMLTIMETKVSLGTRDLTIQVSDKPPPDAPKVE